MHEALPPAVFPLGAQILGAGAARVVALSVIVAAPAPTVNVLLDKVPLPLVFTDAQPEYPVLFVPVMVVALAVAPHNVNSVPYSTKHFFC